MVSCIEDLVVSGVGEFHSAYMLVDIDRELKRPQGLDGFGAATTSELVWFVTDIVNNLLPQLRGEAGEDPTKGFFI